MEDLNTKVINAFVTKYGSIDDIGEAQLKSHIISLTGTAANQVDLNKKSAYENLVHVLQRSLQKYSVQQDEKQHEKPDQNMTKDATKYVEEPIDRNKSGFETGRDENKSVEFPYEQPGVDQNIQTDQDVKVDDKTEKPGVQEAKPGVISKIWKYTGLAALGTLATAIVTNILTFKGRE